MLEYAICLYFVRSGWIYALGGNLNGSGNVFIRASSHGNYWTSRSNTTEIAYAMQFTTTINTSFGSNSHFVGLPLRCLSTILDI